MIHKIIKWVSRFFTKGDFKLADELAMSKKQAKSEVDCSETVPDWDVEYC